MMKKTILLTALSALPVLAQYGLSTTNYSIPDQYYGSILWLEETPRLISQKINYPGLVADSGALITAGVRDLSSCCLDVDKLYGCMEGNTRLGRIGTWIGNTTAYYRLDSEGDFNAEEVKSVKGSWALWHHTRVAHGFKGFSLQIDGKYLRSLDEQPPNTDMTYTEKSDQTNKDISIIGTSLFTINKGLWGRAGFTKTYGTSGRHDRNVYYISWNDSSYIDYYTYDTEQSTRIIFGGLITGKGQSLTLAVKANTENFTRHTERYAGNQEYGSGYTGLLFDISDGRTFTYLKHRLFLGIQGVVDITWPFESDDAHIEISDLLRNQHQSDMMLSGQLHLPVMAEIAIFKTDMYIIAAMTAKLYVVESSLGNLEYNPVNRQRLYTVLAPSSIGLRGRIGQRLEFMLLPSFEAKMLTTGFELKYLFKN